jgi:hypothetical protein
LGKEFGVYIESEGNPRYESTLYYDSVQLVCLEGAFCLYKQTSGIENETISLFCSSLEVSRPCHSCHLNGEDLLSRDRNRLVTGLRDP